MSKRQKPDISPRKMPRQARSTGLVAAVLEAAVQVLAAEGAARFTMARVAERAGVSVGSLYQYFPNKAAILFRLQCDEWQQTSAMLRTILADPRKPPLERLHELVQRFVRSECDEIAIRRALGDTAPMYRDAPETHKARASGQRAVQAFMREVLPMNPESTRRLAAALLTTTLGAVGQHISESSRPRRDIDRYSGAMSDMFCAYLRELQQAGEMRASGAARRRLGTTRSSR